MSLENHPNFHALKFTTEVTASLLNSIRGDAQRFKIGMKDDLDLHQDILDFVEKIESKIDNEVRNLKPK